ncbi:cell division protein FtsZ [Massilia eurypsychrophila]|uniref:Cell division protein FtsZ n=1 Tax=Massilia eurypsychrophila TaxID=1485217 RepID=A0A2G8TI28_9BURK|nr:cell division protein FtsZ [Massilia eurypsychrophila]PIL45694.1 cell division protein FtsZ [Massilia eurypsychrophila]
MSDLKNPKPETVIKVIGVGGAGGNAVNHMASSGLSDIEFICANTDAQALSHTGDATRIQLGESGLGAGSDPVVGRESAIRERTIIADALKGANMVFITAGMGGGTGTGAAPIVAEVAREMGILTVGVVSKPFEFEGARRMRVAEEGIALLSKCVDSLVIVLNSRLEEVLGDDITQKQAFRAADEVLSKAVTGIAEIINVPGMINVDFEDVRTVMRQTGTAMMGSAEYAGEDRAVKAAEEAISCPLLDGSNLHAARGLLVNIAASEETLKLRETKLVMNVICAQTSDDAIIKFGAVFDDSLGDAMRVTVVATGLSRPMEVAPPVQPPMSRPMPGQPGLGPNVGNAVRAGGMRTAAPAYAANRQSTLPAASPGSRLGTAPRHAASNSGEETEPTAASQTAQPGNH